MDTSTLTAQGAEPLGEPDEHEPARPRLRRSRHGRMLAGVARGIADRFDVDVSLVRVAFVVLACAWGLGILVYAAMWALVPRSTSAEPSADDAPSEPTSPWLAYLLLAGVLAFGLLVVSSWWGGPRWGGAVGVLWFVVLFGFLAVAISAPGSRISIRRVLGILVLGLLSLVILAVGGILAVVAWTGVPISGDVGQRVYVPTNVAQLQSTYRLAVGDLQVDLRRVHFAKGGRPLHLTASVAIGVVTIDVPPGIVVDVDAHSGVGNVTASTGSLGQFGDPTAGAARTRPQLVLDVAAGVGQVQLVRGQG